MKALREAWFPLVVGLAARATTIWVRGLSANDFPDGADYVHIALTVFSDHSYPEAHYFARPPLYPLLLVPAAGGGAAAVVLWAKLLNVLAGGVSVLLASRFVGTSSRLAANLAALTVACNPMLVYFASWVSTESVYTALLLAALLLTKRALESVSVRSFLGAGLGLGLTILCRPTAQAIAAAILLALLWFPRGSRPPVRVRRAGFVLLSCGLTVAPWALRNRHRHGELLPLSDGGGIMFYLANSDFGWRFEAAPTRREYLALERELYDLLLPKLQDAVRGLGPSERDRLYFGLSADWIRANPGAFARTTMRRLRRFCAPWVSHRAYSPTTVWLSAAWLVPLYVVGIPALGARVRRRDTMATLAVIVVMTTVATVGAFFHTQLRYRVANVDLFLGIFGGAFVARRRSAGDPAQVGDPDPRDRGGGPATGWR